MKQFLLATIAIVLLLAPLAAEITVGVGSHDGPICPGKTIRITWNAPGVTDVLSLKLRLDNAPAAPPVMEIATNVPAFKGEYLWVIPASVAPGKYLVRVRTVSDTPFQYGDSLPFNIEACGSNVIPKHKASTKSLGDLGTPGFLQIKKPDLVVCKVLPEILDLHLGSHMLKCRVHNVGQGNAEACTLRIELCGYYADVAVNALKAGEFQEIAFEAGLPHIKESNPYMFFVDNYNKNVESDESNNALKGALTYNAIDPYQCSDGNPH